MHSIDLNRNIKKTSIIILSLFFLNGAIFSQIIPNEYFEYKLTQLLYDSGQNWKSLSFFNDIRFQTINIKKDKNNKKYLVKSNTFVHTSNKDLSFVSFSHFRFKKKYYGYLYSKAGHQNSAFHLYKNLNQKDLDDKNIINVESSGFGYQNNWVTLQIGKGKESWGAGENIEFRLLVLVDDVEMDRKTLDPLLVKEETIRDGAALALQAQEGTFSIVLYLIALVSLSLAMWLLVMNRRIRSGELEPGAEDQTEEVLEELNLSKTLPQIDLNIPPPSGLVIPSPQAAPAPVVAPTPSETVRAPPPIPPTGLPQGWTQEQWSHFGWQFVEAMKK